MNSVTDREVARSERRLAQTDKLAAALILTEFRVDDSLMVADAVPEASAAVFDALALHLGKAAKTPHASERVKHYEAIGRLIAGTVDNHCARLARKEAERMIEGVECGHCFDEGCLRCRSEKC